MTGEPLTAIGVVRARPGQEQELGRRMAALLAPTRAEPGCIAYDLFRSTENAAIWVVIEKWRSAADLDAHADSDHMATFLERSSEVIDRPPDSFRLRPAGPAAHPRHETT